MFEPTKVIRGRMTVYSPEDDGSGTYRVVDREIMFNPSSVDDTKNVTYGSTEVPGASHPVTQYGAGGLRMINFTLYVDGDRGRHRRGPVGDQARAKYGLSVRNELYFYRALVMPREYGQSMKKVFPYIVLFTMGDMYDNLPCIVRKADWKLEAFTPKMEPVRASIALSLEEQVSKSQTAEELFALGGIE